MDNQKEMTSDQRFMVWSAVMESEDQKYAARAAWRQQESHYASLRQENAKLREVAESMAGALNTCKAEYQAYQYRFDEKKVNKALQRWKNMEKKDGE